MKPVETDGGLQITGAETEPSEHAIVAPLEQLFTGLRVGLSSLTVRCCACGTELGEGDTVSVYAYRTVETPRWHLPRCRCSDCASDDIDTPTLGTTEVRLDARLAVVSDMRIKKHRLCLTKPVLTGYLPPTAGAEP